MIRKSKSFFALVALISIGCGTLIGSGVTDPTGPNNGVEGAAPQDTSLDFSAPVQEYGDSVLQSCGSFTEQSSVADIDAGRTCIHTAFDDCVESRYLYNKKNTDGSRFVSFVSITKIPSNSSHCQINIHTVSNVQPGNIGDASKSCTELSADELPEVACGIQ